ncbi:hypothetical protein D1872_244850 [compost metagenome]
MEQSLVDPRQCFCRNVHVDAGRQYRQCGAAHDRRFIACRAPCRPVGTYRLSADHLRHPARNGQNLRHVRTQPDLQYRLFDFCRRLRPLRSLRYFGPADRFPDFASAGSCVPHVQQPGDHRRGVLQQGAGTSHGHHGHHGLARFTHRPRDRRDSRRAPGLDFDFLDQRPDRGARLYRRLVHPAERPGSQSRPAL